MEFLEWKDVYSVGVPELDQEHLQIVLVLNKLYLAVSKERLAAAVGPLIEELVAYTQSHFRHEEEEMEKAGYADRARHEAEHRDLETKVLAYQTAYREGRLKNPQELIVFVRSWLTSHIMGSDSHFGEALRRARP